MKRRKSRLNESLVLFGIEDMEYKLSRIGAYSGGGDGSEMDKA